MKVVIQRVLHASVTVDGAVVGQISNGLMCLVGIHAEDTQADSEYIIRKILNARLWPSEKKAWDLSVMQSNHSVLCVSQFTLDCRFQGNKPDFSKAMAPQAAKEFYENFLENLKAAYMPDRIQDGVFGAKMKVTLENDGPVTVILDSRNR
jgi:D-tyrosyl-tRNA(Tyr) deacylase